MLAKLQRSSPCFPYGLLSLATHQLLRYRARDKSGFKQSCSEAAHAFPTGCFRWQPISCFATGQGTRVGSSKAKNCSFSGTIRVELMGHSDLSTSEKKKELE